jgi:hypothetical protein
VGNWQKKFYGDNIMWIVKCPHCDEYIEILELGCRIFRHAYYIDFRGQVNQHASKEELEKLLNSNDIFGCGKPFTFDGINVGVCDYI